MEKDFVGDLYHIVIYDQIDDDSTMKWDNVLKHGPSKICGRQPFLNTVSQMIVYVK